MRSISTLAVATIAFLTALTGCVDPSGNPPDKTEPNTPVEELATVSVIPSFLGESYECNVFVDGLNAGWTGNDINAPVGEVTLSVGNAALETNFDYPVHQMYENGPYVSCGNIDAILEAGSNEPIRCEASMVFEGRAQLDFYACSLTNENCGEESSTVDLYVNSDLELECSGSGFCDYDWYIVGDELATDRTDLDVIESLITVDGFTMTYSDGSSLNEVVVTFE